MVLETKQCLNLNLSLSLNLTIKTCTHVEILINRTWPLKIFHNGDLSCGKAR